MDLVSMCVTGREEGLVSMCVTGKEEGTENQKGVKETNHSALNFP